MDHMDAEHMRAVERYVLGDLSVSEIEEFERHFFDCPQCSEELRTLTMFQENARAVFLEPDPTPVLVRAPLPEKAASWWSGFSPLFMRQWAGALGALLIGIFAGYMVFSSRQSAQEISAYPLHAEARGASEELTFVPQAGAKFYSLYLDRTWDSDFDSYRAVVRDTNGNAEKFTLPVTVGQGNGTIYVLIPAQKLGAGRYVLLMEGTDKSGKETNLERYPFTVRFK
jgi:hypothetical protein